MGVVIGDFSLFLCISAVPTFKNIIINTRTQIAQILFLVLRTTKESQVAEGAAVASVTRGI